MSDPRHLPHLPGLIDSEECRAALNIGRTAFYGLAQKDGLPIPVIRVGRQLRFSRAALERLLTGEVEPATSGDAGSRRASDLA
ncbi:MAG: hypothetical protein QM753_11845 [Thermomicrobiales bacterium]